MNESQVTETNFVDRLLAAVPDLAPVVDEHLADSEGEVLLHLLVADVLRFSSGAIGSGDQATASRVLTFMSAAFENADGKVRNAIAVSFVEHVGALPNETPVTRQSMNVMLQHLIDRGLVARPAQPASGRELPASLTPAGTAALDAAQSVVDGVEQRMLAGLTAGERDALARGLAACVAGLES